MILNPSHDITFSGLPPDVLDAYVRYKKGTRAIVTWIVQFAPSKYHGARSLPLRDLARLASSLAGRVRELPEVIHFHFRETIAARRRLSKYFRGNVDESLEDVDTVNHEHFTTSLNEIYEGLCACCNKSKVKCETSQSENRECDGVEVTANRFEGLSLVSTTRDMADEEVRPVESCSECTNQAPTTCSGIQTEVALVDDDLGNRIQAAVILQEIGDQIEAVRKVWRQAGNSEICFITAAFVTNIACADLKRLENELRDIDSKANLSELGQMYCAPYQTEAGVPISKEQSSHGLIKQLQVTETAFKHFTEGHQPIKIVTCSTCMQKPAEYVQSAPCLGGDNQSRSSSALVDNIMHLIAAEQNVGNIVKSSSPVFAELRHILVNRNQASDILRLTLQLHLLSDGYQAYLVSNSKPTAAAGCRLAALRLAQQAAKSVNAIIDDKTCFPCRCTQTLAYHLQNLEAELNSYSKQRCWDLYFQSPWVAGNHILEMLDHCHYYGQKLFAYRHYVGSVVHSYNVLQQLAGLEKITLLEGLCERYEANFFPGGRPESSFRACWTRYVGARIKFKKGHRSRNQRDSWCMAIPAHEARKAAGLGVGSEALAEKDENLLFRIKQQDYHVTDAQWETLTRGREEPSKMDSLAASVDEDGFSARSGATPAARLNHFAVFASCVKIISSLSDASHTDAKEQGINCICFASAILDRGDRIINARKLGKVAGATWTKSEREGVLEQSIKAMRDEMRDDSRLSASRWVWEV